MEFGIVEEDVCCCDVIINVFFYNLYMDSVEDFIGGLFDFFEK